MQAAMPWQLTTGLPETATRDTPRARPTLLERLWRILGLDASPRHNSVAFTIALVSLSAKLAKSDGVALKIEAETFERLHDVAPAELVNVRRIFDLAAKDSAGFLAYVQKVADLLSHDRALLHDVLEGLFHIAAADGILHPEEERCLRQTADHFGFDYQNMAFLPLANGSYTTAHIKLLRLCQTAGLEQLKTVGGAEQAAQSLKKLISESINYSN